MKTILALTSLLVALSAFAQTPVQFNTKYLTGGKLNRKIRIEAVEPWITDGTNLIGGRPIELQPGNGSVTVPLISADYWVSVDGSNTRLRMSVPDTNVTLLAVSLMHNLPSYYYTNPPVEITVPNPLQGATWDEFLGQVPSPETNSLDYVYRRGYDAWGVGSIDWQNRALNTADGFMAMSWGLKQMFGNDGFTSLTWGDRVLYGNWTFAGFPSSSLTFGPGELKFSATNSAPSNTTTPVAWVDVVIAGTTYKLPLYQ
jgi:hypothetical protein